MATYSYKGYNFDVDHEPTAQEFAQLSAYVDTLPSKERNTTVAEDFKIGLGQAGSTAVKGLGLLTGGAAGLVDEDLRDSIFDTTEKVAKQTKDYWTPTDAEQGFGGKLTSMLTTLPAQMAAMPFAPAEVGMDFVKAGESTKDAQTATLLRTLGNTAGLAIPVGFGKTVMQGAATGAASNATQDILSNAAISKVAETPEMQEKYKPTDESTALAAILGAGFGGLAKIGGKGSAKADPDVEAFAQRRMEAEAKAKAAADAKAETELNTANVKAAEPTGDLIGAQFGGRWAYPWDTPAETIPKFQRAADLELVPQGERGLFGKNPRTTPQEALKTNHTHPTDDFPLRQEVLEQPEIKAAIDNFRQQAAELEQVANNAISETVSNKAKEQLTALQEEFGRGIEKMGILQPSDAYGRGLYEARGGDKTGAVEYTSKATAGEVPKLTEGAAWENLKPNSPKPVGTTKPLPVGQTKAGKGQRGSIGFFGKDTFTTFADKIKENFPDATDLEIKEAWDSKQAKVTEVSQAVTKADKLFGMSKISPAFLDMWRDQHTNESAIDAIKNSPDSTTSSTGVFHNVFSAKGRLGIQTADNQGIRMGVSRMVTILDENKIKSNNDLNNVETGALPTLRNLETLVGEGDAAAVFQYIRNKQLDPNHDAQLTRQQKTAVDRIKSATDKSWDIIIEQYRNVDPDRVAALERLKQEWYLPHKWNGDFVTYVRNADGKLVTFISEHTKAEAEKAAAYYREALGDEYVINDPAYVGTQANPINKSAAKRIGNADLQEAFAGKFEALIELLSSSDPDVVKAQKAVQSVINRRARSAEEMNQRLKANTEVGGFLGSKPWKSTRDNYFEAKDSFESYVEGVYNWKSAMEIAKFMSEIKEAAPDKVNTYAALVNQFKNMSGLDKPPTNPIVKELSDGFAKTTNLSPKYVGDVLHANSSIATALQTGVWNVIMGIQNLVQTGVTSVNLAGVLAAHGGSLDMTALTRHILKGGLDASLGKTLRKADYDYATAHEINSLGLLETHAKTKAGSVATDWAINKLTQQTESISRLATFYGITDYLVTSGVPRTMALELSKNLTRDYMVNYEQYARPGLTSQTGILGNSLGRLQTFAANAFTQFVHSGIYAAHGLKTGNPKLFLPIAAFMATSIITAGVNGTIPMDVAEKLFNAGQMAGVFPPDARSPRQYMLEEYPNLAIGALSKMTGKYLDPSFRSSVPYLGIPPVWGIIGTRVSDAVSGIKWGMNFLQGLDTSQATKYKAINSFMPTGWRGIPEQQFMVDKEEGKYFSPNTELPTYTGEESPVAKFTNLRSLARGTTNELSYLETSREGRITKKLDDINKDLQKYVNGQVRADKPVSDDVIHKALVDTIKLGGNADTVAQQMSNIANLYGYDSSLIISAIKAAEKNPFKARRLMDSYEALQTINKKG